MASSNQIVPDIVDVEVPETTNSNDAVVPSTTLHKMYVDLMRNYKELKQENDDLLKKNEVLNLINEELKHDNEELNTYRDGEAHLAGQVFRLKDDNKALNKKMEQLKNKHDAEMKSMRFHSNHNACIASKRSDEIKKLKKENEDMEVVINGLVDDKKDLQKKYDEVVKEKEDAEKNFYSNHNALTYVQRGNEVRKLKKELDRAYKQERDDMESINLLKMENKHFRKRNADLNDDRSILRGVVNDLRSVISRQHKELMMWHDCYEQSFNYEEE